MPDCPPIPAFIRRCTQADLATQKVKWSSLRRPWPEAFRDHPELRDALVEEVRAHGRVRRQFVFGCADRDPVELFLAAMAWAREVKGVADSAQDAHFGLGPVRAESR